MRNFFIFLSLTFLFTFTSLLSFAQSNLISKDDSVSLCSGSSLPIDVLANDRDLDGDSIFVSSVFALPANGTATQVGNRILYQSDSGFSGVDLFVYRVCSSDSLGECRISFVFIRVDSCPSPNRAPVTQPDLFIGLEDQDLILDFLGNDSDPDGDSMVVTILFGPFNGSTSSFRGNFFYRGNPNYNGIDVIAYQACDVDSPSLCSINVAGIFLAPINDAPVAFNDTIYSFEDIVLSFVSPTDNDIDVDGDVLYIEITQSALNGTLSINADNRTLTYTPNANFFGTDYFEYQACDSSRCDKARVFLFIQPVNDAPTVVRDSTSTPAETSVTYNVLANDFDQENDPITYSITKNANSGTAFFNASGEIVYTPNSGFYGFDTVYYQVCDSFLCSETYLLIFVPVKDFRTILPEGFSPNGDGINDRLVIPLAEYLKLIKLQVFNRWGDLVFQSEDYKNDWEGLNHNLKQPLPDGTYYYMVTTPVYGAITQFLELRR